MNKISYIFILIGFVLLTTSNIKADDSVVIIVNASSRLDDVNKNDLKNLFLGKKTEVNDIQLIPLKPKKADYYRLFRMKILRMSERKERRFWLEHMFKGNVKRVKTETDINKIIEFVKDDKNGISIIPLSEYKNSRYKDKIKTVKIEGKDYKDNEYILKE